MKGLLAVIVAVTLAIIYASARENAQADNYETSNAVVAADNLEASEVASGEEVASPSDAVISPDKAGSQKTLKYKRRFPRLRRG